METRAHISIQVPKSGKNHKEYWVWFKLCLLEGRSVSPKQVCRILSLDQAGISDDSTLLTSHVPGDKSKDRPSFVTLKCVHLNNNFLCVKIQNSTLPSLPFSPFWFLTDEINLLNDLFLVQKGLSFHRSQRQESWDTISFK